MIAQKRSKENHEEEFHPHFNENSSNFTYGTLTFTPYRHFLQRGLWRIAIYEPNEDHTQVKSYYFNVAAASVTEAIRDAYRLWEKEKHARKYTKSEEKENGESELSD